MLSKPITVIAPALFLAYEFCTARPSTVEGRLSPIAVRALELSVLFFIAGGGLLFVFREILSSDPGIGAWLMVVPLVLATGLFFVAPNSSQLESFRTGTSPGFRVIGPPMLVHSVIFATGSAWTFWAQSAAGAIKGGLSLLPTLNLTFDAMLTYIGKTFIPVHMSASYGWISYPYLSLRGGVGALAIFGLSVAAFRLASAAQRQLRMVAFGIFWFLIAFIPVSNLVPTSTKMADRYLFLPTIGAILAVLAVISWLAANKKSRQFVALATLALVVIGYTGWAYTRTEVWCGKTTLWKGKPHPDLSLWTAAVDTHPDNWSALTSLALVYLNFNPPEAERALVYLHRALEISEIQQQGLPDGKQLDISPLQQALGNAHLALARGSLSQPGVPDGRAKKKESLRQALKYFERAERVPWGFAPAHARLLQNLAEAREELARMYQEEILAASGPQRNPTVTERDALRAGAINALEEARLVLLNGGVSTQDPDFRAVMLAPGTFYFNREVGATPEEKLAWYRKAIPVYQEAGKLFPDDPRPVLYEGLCFQRLCTFAATPEEKRKDFNRAEAAFRKALTLQSQSSDYQPLSPYRALASLYSEAGDLRAALDFLKKVQQLDPGYSQSVGVDRDIQTLERALRR